MVVSREVVEFGFAVFGVAVMTETAMLVGAENRVTVPDQRVRGRPTSPPPSRSSPA
jgi:hypothetical protein